MAAPTVPTSERESRNDYLGEHHVYTPHRVGLPPLVPYVKQLWRRRQFVNELARSELRSQNYNTVFGQLWLVFSPLLNGLVYFLLVDILRGGQRPPEYLPHLLGGIFAWTFVAGTISQSATSVIGGSRLILNTAFPRLLLPVTEVVIAFFRFLPTTGVLAVVLLLTIPDKISWTVVLAVPVFGLIILTAAGLGFFAAALQVYFRDFSHLLPYMLRLGLYLTPILYFAEDAKGKTHLITVVNPLSPVFQLWSDVIVKGTVPGPVVWGMAVGWAVLFFVAGTLFYVSRERDFAVRI